MQLGHAIGPRTLEADDGDEVAVELAGGKGAGQVFLVVEDDRRRLDAAVLPRNRA